MAVRWDWMGTNPVTAFSKRTLKKSRVRTHFLTREEFRRLYDCASQELKPVLVVAVETGMRKEELLAVTLDTVDFRRREIQLTNTKTSSPRRIPLSARALATITDRLEDRGRPRSRYLFCKSDGSRIGDIKKAFAGACRRAGITDFRFHDLRHTFASWFVQDGGRPLSTVANPRAHNPANDFALQPPSDRRSPLRWSAWHKSGHRSARLGRHLLIRRFAALALNSLGNRWNSTILPTMMRKI